MDYEVIHPSYSSAIETSKSFAEKNGFTVDDEEYAEKVGLGPHRPKDGVTNKFSMTLYKNDKPQKKMLQIQVTGIGDKYELNMYMR